MTAYSVLCLLRVFSFYFSVWVCVSLDSYGFLSARTVVCVPVPLCVCVFGPIPWSVRQFSGLWVYTVLFAFVCAHSVSIASSLDAVGLLSVAYTRLTLPTTTKVYISFCAVPYTTKQM